MHSSINPLSEVSDDENVARLIFSPSFLDENGNVGSSAFFLFKLPGGYEDYISVFRIGIITVDSIKDRASRMKPRVEGDTLYGHSVLNVGDIRSLNIKELQDTQICVDVIDCSSKRNPAHAGIIITVDGVRIDASVEDDPNLLYVQMLLAECIQQTVEYSHP